MAKVKGHVHYDPAGSTDVFQNSAIKSGLALAYRIAEDTPSELMRADEGIDIAVLRKKFKGFPFFSGESTNEEIGEAVGSAIAAALDHRRG